MEAGGTWISGTVPAGGGVSLADGRFLAPAGAGFGVSGKEIILAGLSDTLRRFKGDTMVIPGLPEAEVDSAG
jgi:hypothetical protein